MKRSIGLLLGMFIAGVINGQTGFDQLRNVVPPSPNASSIAKYGSWPVSLYTGVPSINIPIYTLKGRSVSVPISLGYHASGNKVGDVASWVGLGWSLQAGGLITRVVRGLPDDYGYFSVAAAFSNPNDLSSGVNQVTLSKDIVASAKYNSDTEEDLYSFTAMGRSYKLLLKADGTVQTMPYSNVKVVSNPIVGNAGATANQSWTVILEDGTQLSFGGTGNFTEFTDNASFQTGDGGGIQYISSWYLNTITSVSGETIKFTYTPSSTTQEQDTYFSQSDYIEYLTTLGTNCTMFSEAGTYSSPQLQKVLGINLSSIASDAGRVDFITNPTERLDLKGGNALSEIKVYSKLAAQYIEDYLFYTSYTTMVSGNALLTGTTNTSYFGYRLHLDSLVQKDLSVAATPAQKWSFDYNSQHLPSRRSYAQDHWGFFNGATTNTTLLPAVYFQVPAYALIAGTNNDTKGFMPSIHELGAYRSVNPAYTQAEILTTIHYPTGGTSAFTYEPNGYTTTQEKLTQASQSLSLNLTQSAHSTATQSVVFTVTQPQYVSLTLNSTISQAILNDQPAVKVYVTITDQSNNAVISPTSVNGSSIQWYDLRNAGTYTYKIWTNADTSNFVSSSTYLTATTQLIYQSSLGTQTFTQYVGGLRIKSIVDNDGNSVVGINTRFFQYASPLVINPLDTVNDYFTNINRYSTSGGSTPYCSFTKVVRNTSTKFSLGAIEGGAIGYGQVTTQYGSGGVNGYTVSTFNSEPDAHLTDASLFPYPASDSRDWRRGLLLEEKQYDAGGHLVKKTSNTYGFSTIGSVIGFKAGYSNIIDPLLCTDTNGNCGITRMYCYSTVEQVKHLSSTEFAYNTATGDSLLSAVNYYYDDSLNTQPTRIVTVNSKGDTILSYTRTALEKTAIAGSFTLSGTAATAIDTMVAHNIVGTPIESEKYVKGILANKALTNYKLQSSGLVLPDNVIVQNTSNAAETRVMFPRYDVYGNLLEQQKFRDTRHDYIWDYKNTYPVAEIVGGDSLSSYTSFEADGTGGWTIGSMARDTITQAITGRKSYTLSSGSISKNGLTAANTYILSYWSKNGSYTISGSTSLLTGKSVTLGAATWTYYEHTVTGVTSVSVTGSGNIDELRLYLKGAMMTSYTYDPLIGVTSQCDIGNRVTYYQYDGFGRLYVVKDQDGNLLKKYCYSFSGQGMACTQFYNVAKSGSFTRNNCTVGGTPNTVTYTVPTGTYYSLISQADADTKAQNDVTGNGQNYANTNGTCTYPSINITATNYSGLSGFTATFYNVNTSVQTVFNIPAAGGTLGTVPSGVYNITIAKSGNTTKYLYTVCTTGYAASVTGSFSNMLINSSCNTIIIDTVN